MSEVDFSAVAFGTAAAPRGEEVGGDFFLIRLRAPWRLTWGWNRINGFISHVPN
jgi:hypothetical protein